MYVTVLSRCLARCGLRSAVCGLRFRLCGSGCAGARLAALVARPQCTAVRSTVTADAAPIRVARGPARLACARARFYLTFSHFISQRAQGPRASGIKAQSALSADGQRVFRGGRVSPKTAGVHLARTCRRRRRPAVVVLPSHSAVLAAGYRSIGRMNTTRLAWRGLAGCVPRVGGKTHG